MIESACMYPNAGTGIERHFCGRSADSTVLGLPLCWQHEQGFVDAVDQMHRRDERKLARRQARLKAQHERIVKENRESDRKLAERLVYYIRRPDGAIKIGSSGQLTKRLQSLRCGAPVELLVTHEGGYAAEKAMHRKFAAHRLDGEWFAPADELIAHISTINARQALAVSA